MAKIFSVAVVVCALAAVSLSAGCSGGASSLPRAASATGGHAGGSSSSSAAAGPAQGTISFDVTVPGSTNGVSGRVRRPAYVSPATHSIKIAESSASTGAALSVSGVLDYGSPGCSSDTTTLLKCSFTLTVPAGSNLIFAVTTFASRDASGTPLASGNVALSVAPGAIERQSLSLEGVVNSISVQPRVLHAVADGTIQTFPLTITALDAAGAVIVGSSSFAGPVGLSVQNDPNGALTLSRSSVSAPDTPVTLHWDSTRAVTDATVSAIGSSQAVSSITHFTPLTLTTAFSAPIDLIAGQSTVSLAVSEANFTGVYALSATGPGGGIVATLNPTATPGSSVIAVTAPQSGDATGAPMIPGPYTLSVSDGFVRATLPTPIRAHYPALIAALVSTPAGSPTFATMNSLQSGPDGRAWFAGTDSSGAASMVAISDQGAITSYPVGAIAPPAGIAGRVVAGPGGTFWLSTTDGRVCRFTVATFGSTCFDLSATVTSAAVIASGGNTMYFLGTDALLQPNPIGGDSGNIPGVGTLDPQTGAVTSFHDLAFPPTDYYAGLVNSCSYNGVVRCDFSNSSAALGADGLLWIADASPLHSNAGVNYELASADPKTGIAHAGLYSNLRPFAVSGPDAQGELLLTTLGALDVLDPLSKTLTPIAAGLGNPYGAASISLLTSAVPAADGSIWFGGQERINRGASQFDFTGIPVRLDRAAGVFDKYSPLAPIAGTGANFLSPLNPPFGFAATAHNVWIGQQVGDNAYALFKVSR